MLEGQTFTPTRSPATRRARVERLLTQNGTFISLTPDMAPVAPLLRMLARYDRHKIEAFLEIGVQFLDLCDGDPDAETELIEDDGTPIPLGIDFGPGCPVADAGELDDEPEADGDETDGNCAEDEPCVWFARIESGPGCMVSDNDGRDEDGH